MKFKINIEAQIKWPDKCVWCSDVPTKKMKIQAGAIWQKKIKLEYPLCSKHYFLLKGVQIIGLFIDLSGGWIFYGILILLYLVFVISHDVIYPILFLIFLVVIGILSVISKPVKMRVSGDVYIMKIRNEDYAREFALLNTLNPL